MINKSKYFYNSKEDFSNLSDEELTALFDKFGFEYNITDKIIKECLIWKI